MNTYCLRLVLWSVAVAALSPAQLFAGVTFTGIVSGTVQGSHFVFADEGPWPYTFARTGSPEYFLILDEHTDIEGGEYSGISKWKSAGGDFPGPRWFWNVGTAGSIQQIYSPFVNTTRPFPDIGTSDQYIYQANASMRFDYTYGDWTITSNVRFEITSEMPMSRVFVTVLGAPTASGELIIQDSGELGGLTSFSGLVSQSSVNSSFFSEYRVYAIVPIPVPEPSTYAMALAGLACGGYFLFRRRKQA